MNVIEDKKVLKLKKTTSSKPPQAPGTHMRRVSNGVTPYFEQGARLKQEMSELSSIGSHAPLGEINQSSKSGVAIKETLDLNSHSSF